MSKVRINPVDGMPERTDADPNCTLCKGHGIVEDGELSVVGCVLIPCPKCLPNG